MFLKVWLILVFYLILIVVKNFIVYGLELPEITYGIDLAKLIIDEACRQVNCLQDGDIIVITSKIISKAKGYIIDKFSIKPSFKAKVIAKITGKPSWEVEAILQKSKSIIASIPVAKILLSIGFVEKFSKNPEIAKKLLLNDPSILIVECLDGRLCSDAGIDASNVPEQYLTYPPSNPNKEAYEIRKRIEELCGKKIGVVITDTELSITRYGSINIAIGSSGINVVSKEFGDLDLYGEPKYGGVDIIIDQIAQTATLLMGQTAKKIPVVIIRGLSEIVNYEEDTSSIEISRQVLKKALREVVKQTIKLRIVTKIVEIFEKL